MNVRLDPDKLRVLLERKAWDQAKLATQSGVAANTVGRAKKGKGIRTDTAQRIAEALGVEVATIQIAGDPSTTSPEVVLRQQNPSATMPTEAESLLNRQVSTMLVTQTGIEAQSEIQSPSQDIIIRTSCTNTVSTLENIFRKRTMRVGTLCYPPLIWKSKQNQAAGVYGRILQEICDTHAIKLNQIEYKVCDAIRAVNERQVDFFSQFSKLIIGQIMSIFVALLMRFPSVELL